MIKFEQAKEHFNNLTNNWEYEEQKYYEEEHDTESADDIPTAVLKESNYKDLRVLIDYFEEVKDDTK